MKTILLSLCAWALWASPVWALEDQDQDIAFELSNLEAGRMVTLPRPATTFVDVNQEVKLSATDMPQNVILTVVAANGGKVGPLTVTIYDAFSDRAKALQVMPGTPALYPFKALSSIRVVPKGRLAAANVRLKIESNKPLGIGR